MTVTIKLTEPVHKYELEVTYPNKKIKIYAYKEETTRDKVQENLERLGAIIKRGKYGNTNQKR